MATHRRTQGMQDRMRNSQRQAEAQREDVFRSRARDNLVITGAASEERIAYKRHQRRMAEQARERDLVEGIAAESRRKANLAREREEEEALAAELARMRTETERDERYRAQLRQQDPELRELERKLRAGYASQALAGQLEHKEIMSETMRQDEMATARAEAAAREKAEAEEKERARREWERGRQYQADLHQQLEDEERRKQAQYEEFLKEKLVIDEIVRRIYAEDRAAAEREAEKKLKTRAEMDSFRREREDWLRLEQAEMEAENARIMQHAQQQRQAEAARLKGKLAENEAKQAIIDRLAADMEQKRSEEEEMERIRIELVEEEMQERTRQREAADAERQLRARIELQRTQAEAMEDLALRRRREAEEEAEFRRQMMEKFAHDDRVEQMNAQKRRMKVAEHKRSVEELLQERRARQEFEAQQHAAAAASEEEATRARKRIIEEERQRMLQEHAVRLLGHLPKGVFRHEDEAKQLGSDFEAAYRRRPAPDLDFY